MHRIDTGNHSPISLPPYRLTTPKKEALQREISSMLANGIIQECESAWAAPVVMVPKTNGTYRICVDYRKLNAITVSDMYPLPRIDDLLHSTRGTVIMSTIDLQSGYWQVPVCPKDQDKSCFITPFGLYKFLRMSFGLRNAPATFQRLIDRFKARLPELVLLTYLDDLIIISSHYEEHVEHLQQVFDRMRTFNLRMNRGKCCFCKTKVKYLGHIISAQGIQPDPTKIEAILKIQPPLNTKEVLTFLQTCSWFRRFVPNFAQISQPLSQLLKKNATWKWEQSQQKSFETMKTALISPPILRAADPSKPYIIRTDASGYALGAALLQGEGADEGVVEYASKLLTQVGPTSYEIADPRVPDVPLGKYHVSAIRPFPKKTLEDVELPVAPIRRRGRPSKQKKKKIVQSQ